MEIRLDDGRGEGSTISGGMGKSHVEMAHRIFEEDATVLRRAVALVLDVDEIEFRLCSVEEREHPLICEADHALPIVQHLERLG